MSEQTAAKQCVVIGGGPAGLTAAYELAQAGQKVRTFEKDEIVGGISRTVEYKGYRYDIGGHRFFTKVELVHNWWMNILSEEFIMRPRLSRIYYNDHFFDYPLKPMNALFGLGPFEAVRVGLSYIYAQLFPYPNEKNFQEWVSNRFGRRLFQIFFETYTEKVWGMKCTEIGADWAAQRIKNLDLKSAVIAAFLGNRGSKEKKITTLIEEFHYPKLGPGMMWERVTEHLGEMGCPVDMQTEVVKLHHDKGRMVGVTARNGAGEEYVGADEVISTMPIRELLRAMDPPPPPEVLEAAGRLRYRDFLTVGLIVDRPELFPDNWIYIHSPKVKVGRIQNFKSWSPYMVPDETKSSIGLEYFVQEGDDVWTAKDEDLIELGKRETETLGLVKASEVVDGTVIRMPKAYPVYDQAYKEVLETIRAWVDPIPNLHLVGRNGQHRYNNQDHSMVTAIYAARNVMGADYDVWDVNVEQEYHEEKAEADRKPASGATGERLVPQKVVLDPVLVLRQAFARYDGVALGVAVGVVSGATLFLATVILLLRGGDEVGPRLALLGNYLPGFEVSWTGAVVGLLVASGIGFVFGFLLAQAINLVVAFHERNLIHGLELFAVESEELEPPR